jgi:formylglycine-generating enzyme required for sulfatase activity
MPRIATIVLTWLLAVGANCPCRAADDAPPANPPADAGLVPAGSVANRNITIPQMGIELIRVPAGQFMVGSPKSEHERYTDEPTPTLVTLTTDFWLGKTVITQGQWQAVMGNNPSKFISLGKDAPVEQVSWDDAMAFGQKLNVLERAAGRLPEGYIYTLPTEVQWEVACRAGTQTPYAGKLDDMAWYGDNGGITTHVVAKKQPNAWGFYDMHGNVWEWTSTWYSAGMLGQSGGKDPAGPSIGKLRVLRGGSFEMAAVPARSSYRFHLPPETKKYSIGFRIALTVPPRPEVPQPGLGGRGGRGRRGRGAQTQPNTTQPITVQQQLNDADVQANDANVSAPNQPAIQRTQPAAGD